MRICFYIAFFFVALSFNCFSQNDGYVALTAGAGLPTGHFGSADASDSEIGIAHV